MRRWVPGVEHGRESLAGLLAAAAAASGTIDRDPHDRSGDRALARVGLLEGAVRPYLTAIAIGASVACDGVCLTVTARPFASSTRSD